MIELRASADGELELDLPNQATNRVRRYVPSALEAISAADVKQVDVPKPGDLEESRAARSAIYVVLRLSKTIAMARHPKRHLFREMLNQRPFD